MLNWSTRLRVKVSGAESPNSTVTVTGAIWLALAVTVAAQHTTMVRRERGQLRELAASVEQLTRDVSPSVVQVVATGYGPVEGRGSTSAGLVVGQQRRIGSGVILDPDGYIVTNAHVVAGARAVQVVVHRPSPKNAKTLELVAEDGDTVDAQVVGVAPELDLALLKIAATGLHALHIADDGNIHQGELVFAFGSPEGLFNSVTMGVVSAVARQLDPDNLAVFIQTDAPIIAGNSGGPLVNVEGEVVGLNTFIVTDSDGVQGPGFAIPAPVVSAGYQQLRKHGRFHTGVIGLQVQAITVALAAGLGLSRTSGVIVSDVLPGSPAELGGVQVQDIVVALNGIPIASVPMLALELFARAGGETVTLDLVRGAQTLSLAVHVIDQPSVVDPLDAAVADPLAHSITKLGILGTDIEMAASRLHTLRVASGVFVAARDQRSLDRDVPLRNGDVIHAVDGFTVGNVDGLRRLLDSVPFDSPLVLQIERDGLFRFVTLQAL
jgi:serine protease Do